MLHARRYRCQTGVPASVIWCAIPAAWWSWPSRTTAGLPAGKREPGENPDLTAHRELKEETGLVAQRWEKLGELVTTPGFSDETLHIYLATGLAQQETERDEDEFIELFTLPLEEAYQQAMRGALPDAKTIAGLAMAHARWTAEHTKGE